MKNSVLRTQSRVVAQEHGLKAKLEVVFFFPTAVVDFPFLERREEMRLER